MAGDYSDCVKRQIVSVPFNKKLRTHFLYPKLVIVCEDKIMVLASETNGEGVQTDNVYEMEDVVVDTMLQEHLLWIVHASGQVSAIDVLEGGHVKIELLNYSSYKIRELQQDHCNVYFISESEEHLRCIYSVTEIVEKMAGGVIDVQITIEKARTQQISFSTKNPSAHIHGMKIFIEDSLLVTVCPMTGFREVISSPVGLQHILAWNDLIIVANEYNMWMINLANDSVVLEFKTDGVKYFPLGTYSNNFYYLFLNGEELRIHCLKQVGAEFNKGGEINGCSGPSIKMSHSQEVLKSQVRSLIDTLISTNANHEDALLQFKPLFDQIENFKFLIGVGTKLCQINSCYKPLIYLLQNKLSNTSDESALQDVCDVMYKMDITEYINFKGITSYSSVNFFDFDFKQLCVMFLANSDFDLASLCWLKYSELRNSVSTDEILCILSAIPSTSKIGAVIIWLKNFVPSLLDQNPFHLDLLVRWTTERIFMLEHSAYWPKIGLRFIEEVTNVLETSMRSIAIRPISIDDLDVLKDRLSYITELKEKYKINMLVGELSSQNQTEVVLIMLRRCYTEDLRLFVQEYLPTYVRRHGFELDDVLRTYIESEAASGGGSIDCSRLTVLLNSFRMPSTKLDCLLNVLRVLDVPWDASVHDLAVTSASLAFNDFTSNDSDRKFAREIEEELNYANLKVVLKKHNYPLNHTDYVLFIHKIINAPIVEVKDLKTVMSVTTNYKNYGSFLYIDRCLRDCNTKEALEYFRGLSQKEMRLVFKSIMSKYDHMINNSLKTQMIERSYIDFIKGVQLLDENELATVENMYHLKNSYETQLNMNDMCRESRTQNEWADGTNIDPSKRVARFLRTHHSQNYHLLNLLQRLSTNINVRTFFETLLLSFPYLDYMSCDKISSMLSSYMNERNNASFLVDSSQVLVQLISNCAEEYLNYLISILSVVNAVINTGIVMKNLSTTWKFHYIYIPMSSFGIEEELLKFYAELTDEFTDNYDRLMTLCSKNEFVPFRLLPHLKQKFEDQCLQFEEKSVSKLLSRISALNEIDELFITSLLLALRNSDAEDQKYWLEDLLKGCNETIPVNMMTYLDSPVVRRIFDLAGMSPRAVSYPPLQILKSKYNMALADIALPDITEETWDAKLVLFYVLKQMPQIELERLHELCCTLNVSVDDGLSLQLISRLTTWDLKYSLSSDELGRRKVCLDSNEKSLFQEAVVIWESIRNKDFIQDILNDLWRNGEVSLHGRLISINPYFYEVYLCIYQLIFGTSTSVEVKYTKEYFLLNFLKDYNRRSNPQQYEFELFSIKGMFPEIGHYRLPFHLFMRDDMWANLKSEITLETYELWLPAVALLSLDIDMQTAKDMICSNALKQTMNTKKPESFEGETMAPESWRLSTREAPLLRAAHRCVRHIANMEWAGACLFYVLQGCSRGADQVAAAQLCYQFAKRWESVQPGNRAVRKMERLHSTLSTRHALHKIEWATDEFVQLLVEPTQLIRAMYLHRDFADKMSRHDVNGAANEIADKNGINISTIRIQILENILEKNIDTSNTDTHIGLCNKTLMTAKYILKATCAKMGAIYLSRIAFDDETDFNRLKKLRALQCLMSIVDPDTALKVTNQERNMLWNSLLAIYYAVGLENVGVPWAVGAFMQDKRQALEQLLAAIGANTDGLKLVAELASRYGDRQICLKVLKLLLRFGLNEDMIPLLLKISSPPDEVVRTAWRAVLLSPFQTADYPITDRQKSKCLQSINLLPLCPVVRDQDLKEIWKNCVRCKCFGIGCLVLPYMTNEARLGLAELRRIDRRNLIASLKNLQTETYLVSGAMYVIENMIPKSCYRQ